MQLLRSIRACCSKGGSSAGAAAHRLWWGAAAAAAARVPPSQSCCSTHAGSRAQHLLVSLPTWHKLRCFQSQRWLVLQTEPCTRPAGSQHQTTTCTSREMSAGGLLVPSLRERIKVFLPSHFGKTACSLRRSQVLVLLGVSSLRCASGCAKPARGVRHLHRSANLPCDLKNSFQDVKSSLWILPVWVEFPLLCMSYRF